MGDWCPTDAHLAPDEIQSCLYIRAGFGVLLRYEDWPNDLVYRVIWREVYKLLKYFG